MSVIVLTEMNKVAYLKLNRPAVRNAFNPEMIAELARVFKELESRHDLRAVVLQGEGKAFCAGADLNWMQEMVNYSYEENTADSLKLFEMFEAIASCTLPVLGLVHGAAFGGALGLVAVCDEVIAEESTQFCFSEVKLGIAPAVISTFINRKALLGKVRPLMLSGAVFNSHIAQQAGLVSEVALAGQGHTILQKVLHSYLQAGPEAVRATKKMLNEQFGMTWTQQKQQTIKVIAERRCSAEGQEGLKSFLQKREPQWREQ